MTSRKTCRFLLGVRGASTVSLQLGEDEVLGAHGLAGEANALYAVEPARIYRGCARVG